MPLAGLGAILHTVCAGDKVSDKGKNTSDCATGFRVMSYADVVACCSVLIWLSNCAQLHFKYRRDSRRRYSR